MSNYNSFLLIYHNNITNKNKMVKTFLEVYSALRKFRAETFQIDTGGAIFTKFWVLISQPLS